MNITEYVNDSKVKAGTLSDKRDNKLFPVFLQLERLRLLIVGGGPVATEKLQAVLQNAPCTRIRIVAAHFSEELLAVATNKDRVELIQKNYSSGDLYDTDIVIVAVNNIETAEEIRNDAKARKILVNVADTPSLCDFYLGSIVQKGNLKIAISTNGKSPTIAKRIKETLNEVIPNELNEVLDNMQQIRNKLRGDFAFKVKKLNEITAVMSATQQRSPSVAERRLEKNCIGLSVCFLFYVCWAPGSVICSF